MLQETKIALKGTRDGLTLLIPPEIPLQEIFSNLKEKLEQEASFFHGADLILDLGPRPFQEDEFHLLREIFETTGARLKGILSDNPITKLMARQEGLPLLGAPSIMHSRVRVDHPVKRERLEAHEKEPEFHALERKKNGALPALFVRRTLRSGQKLHHHGDIAILGDVNPGAEIVASGNILVFGTLRGVAHAGAEGKREAVVVALELKPTQLRIAECIARPPENSQGVKTPELARIQDEAIVIEAYPGGK